MIPISHDFLNLLQDNVCVNVKCVMLYNMKAYLSMNKIINKVLMNCVKTVYLIHLSIITS